MTDANRPAPLSTADLWSIRQDAVRNEDCETSRLASAALWGTTDRQRSAANHKLAKAVAK